MTAMETKTLRELDKAIDTYPGALPACATRRYRELLIRHVAEACAACRPDRRGKSPARM